MSKYINLYAYNKFIHGLVRREMEVANLEAIWSLDSTREGENENFQVGRNGLKIRDPTGLRVGVCRSVIRFV